MGFLSPPKLRMVSVARPAAVSPHQAQTRVVYHDGEKFAGGMGAIDLIVTDYWALRQRSADLFQRNLYARGLIRTLITSELGGSVGLHLEATPEERLLGYPEDGLAEWSEDVENRWRIWAKDPFLCDYRQLDGFGALQVTARREALVVGDVLCVLRQDPGYQSPKLQLINGAHVRTPMRAPRIGNEIVHGVELDKNRRHVAYWVTQPDGSSKRLPAWGEKTGRKLAWLVYGSDKRMDAVRGEPILSIALQSLKEIDRYRDSVQRKATINSMIAGFIKKTEPGIGTLPLSRAATVRGNKLATDTTGETRSFKFNEQLPGLFIEELGHGETPESFPAHGTDEKFADFEQAILNPFAWSNQIPPEVLIKSFRNNYSASQAANNEFQVYVNSARVAFGEAFCEPIYQEWLVSEALAGRVNAPKLVEAWREKKLFVELGAWVSSDWSGNIKPAVDPVKRAAGYAAMLEMGAVTRDRASRELTGTKFSKNVQKLRRENEQLKAALEPLGGFGMTIETTGRPADDEDEPEDDDNDAEDRLAIVRPLRKP